MEDDKAQNKPSTIEQLIQENKSIASNIRKMVMTNKIIRMTNSLEVRIEDTIDIFEKNKNEVMEYITKNNLDITEQDIDAYINADIKIHEKGNAGINRITNNISKNNEIKAENDIISRETALIKLEKPKWYQIWQRFNKWKRNRNYFKIYGI